MNMTITPTKYFDFLNHQHICSVVNHGQGNNQDNYYPRTQTSLYNMFLAHPCCQHVTRPCSKLDQFLV